MAIADPVEPYRREREIEPIAVGCAPDPGDHRIASRAELARFLEAWDRDCKTDNGDKQRKARFERALARTGIDFDREALLILGGWYGTGMARATLELSSKDDVVTAAITWRVRPPPVTPDTAIYRFAFRVDKTRIAKVRVIVDGKEKAVLPIAP
jgi:hypothetical protein